MVRDKQGGRYVVLQQHNILYVVYFMCNNIILQMRDKRKFEPSDNENQSCWIFVFICSLIAIATKPSRLKLILNKYKYVTV